MPTWPKWLFYAGALLLLVAGGYSLYLYFTAWSDGNDAGHWWDFVLGILYLIFGTLLLFATMAYARRRALRETPPDRYVIVKDRQLTYELDQISGLQTIDLTQVQSVERTSVRDLIFQMKDGSTRVLPIYLVEEGEQERLCKLVG